MSKTDTAAPSRESTHALPHPDRFLLRHLGPRPAHLDRILNTLGFESLEQLSSAAIPESIRDRIPLQLPAARSETEALADLRAIASQNRVFRSHIGMGYSPCVVPAVIQRNVLENPGWYTQYTPYQAEISQGRLEGLLAFQTMVADLTGLEIANASLLDEATAAAEAMMMCHRVAADPGRNRFLAADSCHPQTLALIATRARALGIELHLLPISELRPDNATCGVLVQSPDTHGVVHDLRPLAASTHQAGALLAVASDLLALTLFASPGDMGADIALGSAQRFGVPLGFGGPHAAFFATRESFKRQMPGRLVGVSRDSRGRTALRLSLGTREQHIRRERATSNICTAQALLANMAAFYAVYHGPDGLRQIATRILTLTRVLAKGIERLGLRLQPGEFFDTLRIDLDPGRAPDIHRIAHAHHINLRATHTDSIGIALDETNGLAEVDQLLRILHGDRKPEFTAQSLLPEVTDHIPDTLRRSSAFLQHPVFNQFHSETEMLRYLKRLEMKDLSLTASMIPLGSCTMKLNATSEMFPVSWPEFNALHPFAPPAQTAGYSALFKQLESWLAEITGFSAVSLQPNAGSQGEYAGLLVIRAWHEHRHQSHRNVCLIPSSAHGTNPASAVMAGFKVVPVACDSNGNVDLRDLRAKAAQHAETLAALMITYPSTHGVFEEGIREICQVVHQHGGQVYMDGANLNAQVGLTRPGFLGADVCHINLHKTFCIPHGGGGPGMGPIGVAPHLAPFLPGHPVVHSGGPLSTGAVSAAPYGSASILPISWVYIACMGPDGLTRASQVAILNANYIAHRLSKHFPVLYKGPGGLVAHECILDLRAFKTVTAEDVAKRLMDFGFHAPTLSWPVPGTLMVEPTESESLAELDRFCDAMIAIHGEMVAVESGTIDPLNNPLKNAPHTADQIAATDWNRPYTRNQAAYPVESLVDFKFWPAVGRVDNVLGDRNLICSCAGMDLYSEP